MTMSQRRVAQGMQVELFSELCHSRCPPSPRCKVCDQVVSLISLELWNEEDEDENGDDILKVDHDESD